MAKKMVETLEENVKETKEEKTTEKKTPAKKAAAKKTTKKDEIKEEVKENDKISLIMVGDNLIHDKIYKEARKNANYNGYDFKPMYENIKK